MRYLHRYTVRTGSFYAVLFIATSVQRAHGLRPIALYARWRRRVRVQWPRRRNMAKLYGGDALSCGEVLRTWSGLTVGDRGCDPNYKPTRTWEQIAADPTMKPNVVRYAQGQVEAIARTQAKHLQRAW